MKSLLSVLMFIAYLLLFNAEASAASFRLASQPTSTKDTLIALGIISVVTIAVLIIWERIKKRKK